MWSMKWLLFLVNENRGCMLWDKIFPFECKLWVYACWYVMLVFLSVTCAYLTLPLKSWLVGCLHLMVMVVDAFDSVQFRLGGEINRFQLEMTCLRAELNGSEARFVAARVQWERERDDLTYSRDEVVWQLQELLTRMSTSDTAPTDGAGTSTQGLTSSPDLDFKGWLGGDFDDTNPLD